MPDHRAAKSPRAIGQDPPAAAPIGRRGVALAPPRYGIGVADAALAAGVALQFRQSEVESAADRHAVPSAAVAGLPDRLRGAIESLSGLDMGGVRVHYRSSEPARFGALAYTQGNEIHVAPGQERHLAHDAWHVVQQAQGRVAPTIQMKGGIAANCDPALEREADAMGAIAARLPTAECSARSGRALGQPVVQRRLWRDAARLLGPAGD